MLYVVYHVMLCYVILYYVMLCHIIGPQGAQLAQRGGQRALARDAEAAADHASIAVYT